MYISGSLPKIFLGKNRKRACIKGRKMSPLRKVFFAKIPQKNLLIFNELQTCKIGLWGFRSRLNDEILKIIFGFSERSRFF